MKKVCLSSFVCLLIDQIIKIIIKSIAKTIILIPNFLSIIYVENDGVAFSMFSGMRIFIILVSVVFLLYIFYESKKSNKNYKLIYGVLIGGILGNLVDRIIYGYVIDYISLNIFGYKFPVFNFADIFITISAFVLIINCITKEKSKKYDIINK